MAGDLENQLADLLAEAAVRSARAQGTLAKSGAGEYRKTAWKAARKLMGELVTPHLVELASLTERVEFLEQQQAERMARYGGSGNG